MDVKAEQLIYLYDGVPFIGKSQKTHAGRRTVAHNFPYANENPRYIEDLGMAPREFMINACITNQYPVKGGYWAARNAFINILERTPMGVLTSKWSGLSLSVALMSQPIIEDSDMRTGETVFKLHFSQTSSDVPPFNVAPTASVISDATAPFLSVMKGVI